MKKNFYALGRMKAGKRNGTETEYEKYLEQLKHDGSIIWHKFEGIKLRLADNTFYSPDFVVLNKDYQIEIHEVKGYWTDDAKVKIKVASDLYPFLFKAIYKIPKKNGGGWREEIF